MKGCLWSNEKTLVRWVTEGVILQNYMGGTTIHYKDPYKPISTKLESNRKWENEF